MRRPLRLTALLVAGALSLAGCATGGGGDIDPDAVATAGPAAPELTGSLTVFAAASLQVAFDELAADFEALHPSLEVEPVRYDGSSTLATQLVEGAPADVFASADERNMATVVDAGVATSPELFATNTLTLIVPAGNPGGVTGLADLADPDLAVVVCAVEVPCGSASAALLAASGITASVDSFEQNVTAVLTKVAAGEADAGLVYVTDAAGEDDVETVDTAGAEDVVNRYPIAALTASANPTAAAAFTAFVRGDAGRAVLERLGFGAP